jgi:hypothetical protein
LQQALRPPSPGRVANPYSFQSIGRGLARGSPEKKQRLDERLDEEIPAAQQNYGSLGLPPPLPGASSSSAGSAALPALAGGADFWAQMRTVLNESVNPVKEAVQDLQRKHDESNERIQELVQRQVAFDEWRAQSDLRASTLEQQLQALQITSKEDIQNMVKDEVERRVQQDVARIQQQQQQNSAKHSRPVVVEDGGDGAFVADKVWIKGFCEWKKETEQGLSPSAAEKLAGSLLAELPRHLRALIPAANWCRAPYHRNRRVAIMLQPDPSPDDAHEIAKFLNGVVRDKKFNVFGRSFYLAADQPPWKQERNGKLYRASLVAGQNMSLQGWNLVKDWPSGTLYAEKDGKSCVLGRWSRATSWKWQVEGIREVDHAASLDTLVVAMET